jgi:hypothetical protein
MLLSLLLTQGASDPAAQTLTPGLVTGVQTFYTQSVTASNTLAPAVYTNSTTFFAVELDNVGASHTVAPNLYTNTATHYSPTATASNTLIPALATNNSTYFTTTLQAFNTLTAAPYTNANTFYAATVAQTGPVQTLEQLQTHVNSQVFYGAELDINGAPHTVEPALYSATNLFYGPTVYTATTYVLKHWTGAVWETIYKDPVIYG